MRNFSAAKDKDKPSDWKSPAMYTHLGGYKFCVGVDANAIDSVSGNSIYVDLWSMPGEFDEQLKWPAKAKFTIELINQQGGQNVNYSSLAKWDKPPTYSSYRRALRKCGCHFLGHTDLDRFLK